MKVIIRSNDYNENYKVGTLLKNPISRTNSLAEVEVDGEVFWTGGIICKYTPLTTKVLDKLSYKDQWYWLSTIHCKPYKVDHLKNGEKPHDQR